MIRSSSGDAPVPDAGFVLVGVILAVIVASGVAWGAFQVSQSVQNRPDQAIPAEDVTRSSPTAQPYPDTPPTPPPPSQ